jgi:hypothetical protein
MDHAITVGEIVKFILIGGGILVVFGILLAVLAAYGSGMGR